jgi:hypothetical protein
MLQHLSMNCKMLQCCYLNEQYSITMTVNSFSMAITISDHSLFICLLVMSHARRPVGVESTELRSENTCSIPRYWLCAMTSHPGINVSYRQL